MADVSGCAKRIDGVVTRKPVRGIDSYDILVFLIPLMQFIELHVVGLLSGTDILLIVTFVYLGIRGKIKLETSQAKRFMALCSLWLASQVVTDVVRHTAFADYSRGWSNIGLTLVNFAVFFSLLYQKPTRLAVYGWGLAIGSLLRFWIIPTDLMQADPWKFGISYPVTLAVLLFASRKKCRGQWPIILAIAIGIIDIFMGTRSLGGYCVAVALYLSITRHLRTKAGGTVKLKAGSVLVIAASLVIGVIGIVWAYSYAARAGMLGADARVKYAEQTSGKYGLLLGGRVEVLGSLPAIWASPILGHGSWARDPLYLILEKRGLVMLGYDIKEFLTIEDLREGSIPAHSYIFGSWVNAGILGAIFWAWVFVLIAKALLRIYPATVPLLPFAAYAGFQMLWDILYSPYASDARIITPYFIVLLMTCMSMAPRIARGTTRGAIRKPGKGPAVAPATAQ